jgi:hypothetical protein
MEPFFGAADCRLGSLEVAYTCDIVENASTAERWSVAKNDWINSSSNGAVRIHRMGQCGM